jgi:hypothetical protein
LPTARYRYATKLCLGVQVGALRCPWHRLLCCILEHFTPYAGIIDSKEAAGALLLAYPMLASNSTFPVVGTICPGVG